MEDKLFIKALEIKDFDHQLFPGDTIKIYGQETTITGFSAQYNDALEKWETIIHTVGRGDPFERSLDVIEILEDQPRIWEDRYKTVQAASQPTSGQAVWVKASEFKHEVGIPYHAKDSKYKGAGHFTKNGEFVWGDLTITYKEEQDDLFILDEGGQSPTAAGDWKAMLLETIEDILLKTGKHNQEECTELADAVLRDIPGAQSGKEEAVDLVSYAAAVEEGAEAWKMEYDSCRKLLKELVDLKNIKDSEGKSEDYLLRQPIAWERAKHFLERYQHINW